MKIIKSIFIIHMIIYSSIILSGCQHSGGNLTELEGEWRSVCMNGYFEFNGETFLFSGYQILSINKNTVVRTGYSFTEWNCDETQTPEITDEYFSINIGDSIETINGLSVREIDFIYEDREFLDIYLLLDNKSTLFFGKAHGDNFTPGERTKEIDFYVQFTKQ